VAKKGVPHIELIIEGRTEVRKDDGKKEVKREG
jgi:hypothetical protein